MQSERRNKWKLRILHLPIFQIFYLIMMGILFIFVKHTHKIAESGRVLLTFNKVIMADWFWTSCIFEQLSFHFRAVQILMNTGVLFPWCLFYWEASNYKGLVSIHKCCYCATRRLHILVFLTKHTIKTRNVAHCK